MVEKILDHSNIPENTIAIYVDEYSDKKHTKSTINRIIGKPDKKRDWFKPHFYHCLPLTLGNQYGFVITTEYDFTVVWNGGDEKDDVVVTGIYPEDVIKDKYPIPDVVSHFGNGTVSIVTPFLFRTPKGVNLFTINPPNHIMKNITVLSGLIETDMSRMPFTFNWKIHEPNVITHFKAGTPIAAFIPVQRMFVENFNIVDAENIVSNQDFLEDSQSLTDHIYSRDYRLSLPPEEQRDGLYFSGTDVYGNKFPEHQTSSGKLITNKE